MMTVTADVDVQEAEKVFALIVRLSGLVRRPSWSLITAVSRLSVVMRRTSLWPAGEEAAGESIANSAWGDSSNLHTKPFR